MNVTINEITSQQSKEIHHSCFLSSVKKFLQFLKIIPPTPVLNSKMDATNGHSNGHSNGTSNGNGSDFFTLLLLHLR
jgi:hypothetical protein